MKHRKFINKKRLRRRRRVRAKIFGTANMPRLSVFRSNKSISAQLIDDGAQRTLVAAHPKDFDAGALKKTKTEKASILGEMLAKKAVEAGIKRAVFDRRGYKYHGRIRAVAEGARRGGLKL